MEREQRRAEVDSRAKLMKDQLLGKVRNKRVKIKSHTYTTCSSV